MNKVNVLRNFWNVACRVGAGEIIFCATREIHYFALEYFTSDVRNLLTLILNSITQACNDCVAKVGTRSSSHLDRLAEVDASIDSRTNSNGKEVLSLKRAPRRRSEYTRIRRRVHGETDREPVLQRHSRRSPCKQLRRIGRTVARKTLTPAIGWRSRGAFFLGWVFFSPLCFSFCNEKL